MNNPAKFEIWKCTVFKVIVSQKKESTLNHWNESFLKRILSRFMLMPKWQINILPAHLLPLDAAFGALKIAVSPVTAVHIAALHSALNEIDQSYNHRKLASHKRVVWKNESLIETFGSRWANKVKINTYYKKVFFWPCMHVNLLLGLPKPKYEPFIHIIGAL